MRPDTEKLLSNCSVCPRRCGVNRMKGEVGFCRSGFLPKVASYNLHFGEEPPISGSRGSGTIFFSNCNMRCVYCQNYPISQFGVGNEVEIAELADMMLSLQSRGAHNINLVTPTHFVPQILEAVGIAKKSGLSIPIVYNTSGYESVETLHLLDGVVDIYLVDMRYSDNENALRYSSCPDYVEVNRQAVLEMHRQVGDLLLDKGGVAKKGVIVRLLVLPNGISGTEDNLRFLLENVGNAVYISLMSQYFPAYRSREFPLLSRRISAEEYTRVVELLEALGFENGWVQPHLERSW
ncbi:radical SAM protein [bacterium]|nr:radical SAM protein [bacterium]